MMPAIPNSEHVVFRQCSLERFDIRNRHRRFSNVFRNMGVLFVQKFWNSNASDAVFEGSETATVMDHHGDVARPRNNKGFVDDVDLAHVVVHV